jgi:hypothetical protein
MPSNTSQKETSNPPSSSCATPFASRQRIPRFARGSPKFNSSSAIPWRPSARRKPRARDGNEADYLPVLAEALLRQEKFADIPDVIKPGDRDPALESKVRTALGTAAAGMRDRDKARVMLRDAIRLDPSAADPRIQLAQLLSGTKPAEGGQADL